MINAVLSTWSLLIKGVMDADLNLAAVAASLLIVQFLGDELCR